MEENKMFVVITVLLIILAGIAVYLFSMDRRTRKIAAELEALKEAEKKNTINTA